MARTGPPTVLFEVFWAHQQRKRLIELALADVELPSEDDPCYVLSGAVEEWRYKTGVDGEPVAGVTLELIDTAPGRVVWSATGTRTGWSRSSLSGVASTLIGGLLSPLRPRS